MGGCHSKKAPNAIPPSPLVEKARRPAWLDDVPDGKTRTASEPGIFRDSAGPPETGAGGLYSPRGGGRRHSCGTGDSPSDSSLPKLRGQQQRDSATSHHAPWAGAKVSAPGQDGGDDAVQTFLSGPLLGGASGSKIPKGLLVPLLAARRSDAGAGDGYSRRRHDLAAADGSRTGGRQRRSTGEASDSDSDGAGIGGGGGVHVTAVNAAASSAGGGRAQPQPHAGAAAGRGGGGRRSYVESDSGTTPHADDELSGGGGGGRRGGGGARPGAHAASCDGVVPTPPTAQPQQQIPRNRHNRGQQGRVSDGNMSFPPSVGPPQQPQPPSPPQQLAAGAGLGGRGRAGAGAGSSRRYADASGDYCTAAASELAADKTANSNRAAAAGTGARRTAGDVGPAAPSAHDSRDAAAEAEAIAAALAAAQAAALEEEAAEERARAEAEAEARVQAELAAGVTWVIRPGPPIESVYRLGRTLGKGSFGVVRAAVHTASGAEVAVKTISKSLLRAGDIAALRREVEILHHLRGHPHISELLGVFEEPTQLHLVLEMYKGGDLFDAIISVGRHSERAAADVMRTVLTAIAYCHAMGVAHRDIKPENFMLSEDPAAHDDDNEGDGAGPDNDDDNDDDDEAAAARGAVGSRLKLIDFGLSVFCTDSCPLSETVGTSYYVAPEVLAGCYSRAADVWSAGVILHIMLAGYAPFDGRNDDEILRAILKGNLDLQTDPIWQSISREAVSALSAMLERDPNKRATADQLLAMPWFGRTAAACAAPSAPLPGVVSERMRRFARMNSFKREARRVVAGLMRREEVAGLVAQFRALDVNGDGKLSIQELKEGLARQELRLGGPNARPLTEREVEQLLARSDLDGDGLLDESEFIGATLPAAAITRKAQHALAAANAAATAARGATGTASRRYRSGVGAVSRGAGRGARPTSAAARAAAAAAASRPGSAGGATALLAAAFAHFDTDGSGYITEDELRAALAAHHPAGQGPDIKAIMAQFDIDGDGRIDYDEFLKMMVQADEEDEEEGGEEAEMLDVSSAPLAPEEGEEAGSEEEDSKEAAAASAAAEAADRVGGCYVGVRPRSARPGNNRITAADVARLGAASAAVGARQHVPLARVDEAAGTVAAAARGQQEQQQREQEQERRGVKSRKVTMAWAMGDQVLELEAEQGGAEDGGWGRTQAPGAPLATADKRSPAGARGIAASGAGASAAAAATRQQQQQPLGTKQAGAGADAAAAGGAKSAAAGAGIWSDSDDSAEEEVLFDENEFGPEDRHSRHSRPSGKGARGRGSAAMAAAAAAHAHASAPAVRRDTYVTRPTSQAGGAAELQPFTPAPTPPAASVKVVAVAPRPPPSAGPHHDVGGGTAGGRPTSRPPALQLPTQSSGGPSRPRQSSQQQPQHLSAPNAMPHAASDAADTLDQPIGGGRAASSSSGAGAAYLSRGSPHGPATAAARYPASPAGAGGAGASTSGTVGRLARSTMQGGAVVAPAPHSPYGSRAHPPALHQVHPGGPRHHDPIATIYGGDSSGGSLPGSPSAASAAAYQRLPGARTTAAVPGPSASPHPNTHTNTNSPGSASAPLAKLPAAPQPQLVVVQAGRGGAAGGAARGAAGPAGITGGAYGPRGPAPMWTSTGSTSSSPTGPVAHGGAGSSYGGGGSGATAHHGTRSSGSGARGVGDGAVAGSYGSRQAFGEVSDSTSTGYSEPMPSLGSDARARRQSTGSAWQQQTLAPVPAQAASPPSPHPPVGRLQPHSPHSPLHSNPLSPKVPMATAVGGGGLVSQLQQLQAHRPPLLLEEELVAPSPHSGGSASASLRPRGRRTSMRQDSTASVEASGAAGASAELWTLHGGGGGAVGTAPPGAAGASDTWVTAMDDAAAPAGGDQLGGGSGPALGARLGGGGLRGTGLGPRR